MDRASMPLPRRARLPFQERLQLLDPPGPAGLPKVRDFRLKPLRSKPQHGQGSHVVARNVLKVDDAHLQVLQDLVLRPAGKPLLDDAHQDEKVAELLLKPVRLVPGLVEFGWDMIPESLWCLSYRRLRAAAAHGRFAQSQANRLRRSEGPSSGPLIKPLGP